MEAAYRLGRVLGTGQFGDASPTSYFSLGFRCEDGNLDDGAVVCKERLSI